MIDHKELMNQGQKLIAANLAECCREELEWQNTALLRDGKMREAGAIYAQVDSHHALSIVQSEVARQAMQALAAAPQVVADERAAFDPRSVLDIRLSGQGLHKYLNGDPIELYPAEINGLLSEAYNAAAPVQAQEPVAWSYECRQPLTDPAVWCKFINREKPSSWQADYVRNIEPLYRAPVQPVAVPDGWKLVPIEPTDEMRDACHTLNYQDEIDAE